MTGPAAAPARSPVIVLGMHRSGTSMLTGSLEAAGVLLGEVNNAAPHNRKGNKEHEGVRGLNDRIMARYGADWKSPPHDQLPLAWTQEELAEGLAQTSSLSGSGRVWGFKDPRTIWTLEGWLALYPAARLIGVFRHPVAVMNSLLARPGALQIPEGDALALWERTNRRLLSLRQRLGFPLLHFSETDIEGRFMGPLGAFTRSLGLEAGPAGFFDAELVHQTGGDALAPGGLTELFSELRYQAGASACSSG
jgi:hypothetical protein